MDDHSEERIEKLKRRIVGDIEGIRIIKIDLLKLAASREDTELAEIANRLHLARCNLANTITVIMGYWLMASQGLGQIMITDNDCAEMGASHDAEGTGEPTAS